MIAAEFSYISSLEFQPHLKSFLSAHPDISSSKFVKDEANAIITGTPDFMATWPAEDQDFLRSMMGDEASIVNEGLASRFVSALQTDPVSAAASTSYSIVSLPVPPATSVISTVAATTVFNQGPTVVQTVAATTVTADAATVIMSPITTVDPSLGPITSCSTSTSCTTVTPEPQSGAADRIALGFSAVIMVAVTVLAALL